MIELMIVLAIGVGLIGASIYSINVITASKLKDQAMRLTSTIKHAWNQAALNKAQYRLVIDLDSNSYHTEVAEVPSAVEEKKRSDDLTNYRTFKEGESRKLGGKDDPHEKDRNAGESDPFGVNKTVSYKKLESSVVEPTKLPAGIEFVKVHTTQREEAYVKGKTGVLFFPNGFQQPAIIVLKNKAGSHYSVVTEPLTGRVKIFSKKLKRPSEFGQGEDDD